MLYYTSFRIHLVFPISKKLLCDYLLLYINYFIFQKILISYFKSFSDIIYLFSQFYFCINNLHLFWYNKFFKHFYKTQSKFLLILHKNIVQIIETYKIKNHFLKSCKMVFCIIAINISSHNSFLLDFVPFSPNVVPIRFSPTFRCFGVLFFHFLAITSPDSISPSDGHSIFCFPRNWMYHITKMTSFPYVYKVKKSTKNFIFLRL